MRPLSLATRLTLFFAVAAAVVFPIFGWVISREMANHFAEGDTAELEIIADAVEDALSGVRSPGDFAPIERRFEDLLIGHHSASLYIDADDGRTVFASAQHPDLSRLAQTTTVAPGRDLIELWSDSETTYRVLMRRVAGHSARSSNPHTIVVATPIDYHLAFLAEFRRTLWLMVISSILFMSLMGWIAVRQGHAPLREIVGRMRRVSSNEPTGSIPPSTVPRELSDLAISFNEMLARVDDAFQRLANFNADIAHELRTPITNLMTQTQVALSKARTVGEYRDILYSNMEEYERMAQMVSDMLFLAKTENAALEMKKSGVDLASEIRALLDYYEGWAEERGVSLTLLGNATVPGDRLLLQRALGNLLSNAIRHSPTGGIVRVTLDASRDGAAHVAVQNSGSMIPPEHLRKLFDRFYRVDPSRQRRGEGAGLGLAIVKSIIEAHDGTIEVISTDAATTFNVTLPLKDSGDAAMEPDTTISRSSSEQSARAHSDRT